MNRSVPFEGRDRILTCWREAVSRSRKAAEKSEAVKVSVVL